MALSSTELQQAFELSPDGVLLTDTEGMICWASAELARMSGYSVAELIGKPVELLVPRRQRDGHVAMRRSYDTTPVRRPMGAVRQLRLLRRDGTELPVDVSLSPIDTREGRRVIASVRDTTEQQLREARLGEALALIQAQLDAARTLQLSLLPDPDAARVAGVEAAGVYRSCDALGGDLYDIIPLGTDRVALLMLDVVGHGVAAALSAAMAKAAFFKSFTRGGAPDEILTQVNRDFLGRLAGSRGTSLTACVAVVESGRGRLVYASAGHPPMLLVRRSDPVIRFLSSAANPLGLSPCSRYHAHALSLERGDRLISYTDGLIDAHTVGARRYGLGRLRRVARETQSLALQEASAAIIADRDRVAGSTPQTDDISLLMADL